MGCEIMVSPGIIRNRKYEYNSKSNLYPETYRMKRSAKQPDASESGINCRDFEVPVMVNKRDMWQVATRSTKEAHCAVFPESLIVDCIKVGCPKGGLVLDPFMGSGTTAFVTHDLGRNYIGFELNLQYVEICEKRISGKK
ncbi:site-specific DNA-methyltransferase [Phocaeicola vulgatus]|mgnify:CR=1 FL=1|jgi:DNA modification methylase|nr:site-specific DNA-methyltransferase [Phocaeicola vulgatus]